MSIEVLAVLSIGLLFLMFAIGTFRPINMGIMGFVAAFVFGTIVCGLSAKEVMSGFSVSLFIILAGVTYFFSMLKDNGTIDTIVAFSLRLVKGNAGLIPWVMFALELLLCSIGTQGTAAIIIVAPIALQLASACGMSQLMMSLMVAFGMTGGIFSPLNVMGLIVQGVLDEYSLPSNHMAMWLCTVAFSFGLALITYFLFGGHKFLGAKGKQNLSEEVTTLLSSKIELNAVKVVSLISLAALIFMVAVLEMNVGFAAMTLGLVMAFMQPKRQSEIVKSMPWGIILMISGIVTYVGMMESIGVMDYLTQLISSMNNPKLAALATAYIGGFVSAFVSTTGFLGGVIPLCASILEDPSIWPVGAVACVCMSASIVDVCPFSTTGAIFVANAQGKEKTTLYKSLLYASALIVAFGPLLAWLVFVAFV